MRVVQSDNTTEIYYTTGLAKHGVRLTIYDVVGRRVRTFEREPHGNNFMVSWDRRDHSGRVVSRGIYFADLRTERCEGLEEVRHHTLAADGLR